MSYMTLLARSAAVLLIVMAAACSKKATDSSKQALPTIPPHAPGFNDPQDIERQEAEGVQNAQNLLTQAEGLLKAGKSDEAIATLRKAAEEDAMNAKVHSLLGQELFRRGYMVDAEKALRHAMRVDPNLTDAIIALADLKIASQKPDEAAALYRLALANDPNNATAKAGLEKAVKPPAQ